MVFSSSVEPVFMLRWPIILNSTLGFVDAVIPPSETRKKVCTDLRWLRNKEQRNPRKKHGNIPL